MRSWVIRGVPRPASRPRVTRNGTFYSKTYRDWKKNALEQYPPLDEHMFDGPIQVRIHVLSDALYIEVSELLTGQRPKGVRGDVDNYIKSAMDFLQDANIIVNDRQVEKVTAILQ